MSRKKKQRPQQPHPARHRTQKPERSRPEPRDESTSEVVILDRLGRPHPIRGKGAGAAHPPASGAKPKFRRHPEPREKEEEETPKSRGPARRFKDRKPGRFDDRPRREETFRHPPGGAKKLKATIDKNRKGFGFLAFETRGIEDRFVPPHEAQRFFHGDRVEVNLSGRGEVSSIELVERRFRELVGRYLAAPTGSARGANAGVVIYERKRAREEVYCQKGHPKAKSGDWVRAKLHFHEEGPFSITGEIVEVYGDYLPASADIGMISAEYNLTEEHPADAEREAKEHELKLDLLNRTDLRDVPFITIDGETARDFDDAIFVERAKSGFVLWVAIADVSHYVTTKSALDRDARSRGTSVYFPERAFHMLPRALSENLCSLKPHEPRLAMVARMEYDFRGERTRTELMEAVISSHRRATYNQIHAEWQANRKDKSWEFEPHFALYRMIRQKRSSRGSIDFDLPESEVRVDPVGEPIAIERRPRLDSHRLIEEFMIAANEAVTEWAMEREWPFVYRIHEEPSEVALQKFQDLAKTVGVRVEFSRENLSQDLADLVQRLEGHPASTLLNIALLRSMKQAVYSSLHGGHFGLASPGYTHFTSPIRRYPDLVVHRILRRALRVENRKEPPLKKHQRTELERELADIAEHCSYRERLAADAERESIRLKQVRMMIPRLGEEFDGKVNGMIESGLFIQLDDPYVEGMVSRESMGDDFYEFDEKKMLFYGRRKRRMFRIGDPIRVRVVRADLDRRQVDFTLVS